MEKTLTIQKLNQSYVKLIKMVLNGTYSTNSPLINSFYHDPCPDQAFQLLTKILSQQSSYKKDAPTNQFTHNITINSKKVQLKRATTTTEDRQYVYKKNENISQFKPDSRQNIEKNLKTFGLDTIGKKQNQTLYAQQPKLQKLKRLTGKLTDIFENNHKKILKYQQLSKCSPNPPSDIKYAKPTQITFKKY